MYVNITRKNPHFFLPAGYIRAGNPNRRSGHEGRHSIGNRRDRHFLHYYKELDVWIESEWETLQKVYEIFIYFCRI